MEMEMAGMSTPQEEPKKTPKTPETNNRNEVVAEVFKRYHKYLVYMCIKKLLEREWNGSHILSYNVESDAEEIVPHLYEKLLTARRPVDLTRGDKMIKGYLNIFLDNIISDRVREERTKKRTPERNLVPPRETSISVEGWVGKIAQHNQIKEALLGLEAESVQEADIIKQKYWEEKTLEEIGESYGVSRETIRKIEKKAREKIRELLSKNQKGKSDN